MTPRLRITIIVFQVLTTLPSVAFNLTPLYGI